MKFLFLQHTNTKLLFMTHIITKFPVTEYTVCFLRNTRIQNFFLWNTCTQVPHFKAAWLALGPAQHIHCLSWAFSSG